MADCPNREKNKKNCSCVEDYCSRYGICCECVRYHKGLGEKPACLR